MSVRIESMRPQDAAEVAKLHRKILPTVTARIGLGILEGLYKGLASDRKAAAWVARDADQSQVIGFLSVTLDFHKSEKKLSSWLAFNVKSRAALHLVLSPSALQEWLSHYCLGHFFRYQFGVPYPTVLTLGVAPNSQGGPAAKQLMEHADKFFKQHSLTGYYVDTYKNNQRANRFYVKAGFAAQADFLRHRIFYK